ncbi:MAG: alpha/beta hydrolase [Anaerolineae bacterium]|nr:alpha/beta hydrolase [Anaerolineae bacterium]
MNTEEYSALPAVEPDAIFRYGEDENQFVDLYVPQGEGLHPVVVLVHGGCWRAMYGAKPLGGICRALNTVGIAVWNVEYRRDGNGGGYPQTLLDVARAADLLEKAAVEYPLDLARVISMGHSAGGQLALWLAGRRRLSPNSPIYSADPLPVHGVVCLAGVIDLVNAVAQGLCGETLPQVMGGLPADVPDHYRDASPMALLPLGVRQIHVVGDADTGILANVQPYIEAAEAAGDNVRLTIVPEAGHFEIVVAGTAAWQAVQSAVLALFE